MTDELLAPNKTNELNLGQLFLEVEALKASTNALIKTVEVLDGNSTEIQTFIDETQSRFDTIDQLLEQRALDKEAVFATLAKLNPEQLMMAIRNSRSLMNDRWIMHKCAKVSENNEIELLPPEQSMIFPFIPVSVSSLPVTAIVEGSDEVIQLREKKISYGLTSFGYDVTLAPEFKVFTPTPANGAPYPLIDPKNFDESCYIHATGDSYIIPPNSFMLARTNEFIRMPEDTVAICFNKSTYARCGIMVSTTVLEPGWTGELVLEISNITSVPAKVYANEGIAQLMFFRGERPAVAYNDRNGKYMEQRGIVPPR